jgi:hypothetical protein
MAEIFKNKIIFLSLGLILVVSFILMRSSSLLESATMDELAHIPAGYSYVKFLDYRLNPEHPPLLKVISALPLLFLNLNFPVNSDAWQKNVNGQWDVGREFLYESYNDADLIVQLSRIGPMLLTLFLAVLIFIWSKEIIGIKWALIPTILFALSPNTLAHGHYVTTDIAAAFGFLLALYFFVKFLYFQSKKSLIYAGIAFGIAQLLKFSTFLLIIYFTFFIFIFWFVNVKGLFKYKFKILLNYLWRLILIFLIGYVFIVYPVYFVLTLNYPQAKQIFDTEFILTSFAGGPTPEGKICNPIRCLADLDIWMAKNKILRPFAHYFLGVLMVMQRSSGGNTAYFMGEVGASGWHSYFPTVYLLKEPIPFLIMLLIALLIWLKNVFLNFRKGIKYAYEKILNYINVNFDKFAMIGFVAVYWTSSIISPLNIGFRHLFPVIPFIYILTIASLKNWFEPKIDLESLSFLTKLKSVFSFFVKNLAKYLFLFILLIWFVLESFFAWPYFISYFNEFGGGVKNGYKYVVDSNYDWGQDLLRLKEFVLKNNIDKIAVDYFGGGNPKYYLGDKVEYWWSKRGNPKDYGINWLAVSVNTLQGAMGKTRPGFIRDPEDEYPWLKQIKPYSNKRGELPLYDFRAGTSIFIYKLNQ